MGYYHQVFLSLLGALGFYVFYKLAKIIYHERTSPLRTLPGPPSSSFIFGNMKELREVETQWTEEYGSTITYKSYFGMSRLYTTDVKAINHILMNDYVYQKTEDVRYTLRKILGDGVLVVEEDKHKQQRRIMIRELTEIFVEKAIELRDIWRQEVNKSGRIEALSWLSKTTLDVIGLAGFNYNFNALADGKSELNDAFSTLFQASTSVSILPVIKALVPALRFVPGKRDAEAKSSMNTMKRIGYELLHESKMGLMAEDNNTKVGQNSLKRRDLLSLLLRANTSNDLPLNQRMSDEDVIAQVPTFLVAGHETTSTATVWALYALSLDVRIQSKLRDELLAIGTDNPTMDELNALPYLDAVVRESLRVHSPVRDSSRVAMKDDVIPLAKPIRDIHGNLLDRVRVCKGETFVIPVAALNLDKSIWGGDAAEFKPERWEKLPETVGSVPGVWGNMMTFLGGPRACIGYRFSLVEMKALLFTLIRAFEFELGVAPEDLIKKSRIVRRPLLRSDPGAGNQMPLILKPVNLTM
ncbi:hypothetical protein CVT25_010120 [Psilocybe cyanescens]|uniref:Cytochrome P450 n=1 Tax=Psilocybe cyanescens TaxID=93625 RepID=A0A409XD58_PSICY|nr:hypothetical protein CVT25_010120 [Psilocybe cyanescens]